ncbi:SANT/Myb-like DNA-binding domain-containing protein [Aspergillus candidus]|uniref:Myb-like domain-containing protein n=1 Tax=Aspergillus candidus TaxID=41067 RepID=A0A2I2F475_ASPCN|nr:hypothetical protein BDW47DRAFT_62073 [Aspergillus candidus]PLB35425.1 hypothetical protein BDW47DRAFT_62073 [Aspergillus candidus]
MPVFMIDGKSYRVPLLSSWRKPRIIFGEPPTAVETKPSRWTPAEEALLKELKACHTPWQSISIAMGHKPVAELKRRWDDLGRYENNQNRSLNGRSHRRKFYENPPSTGMSGDEEAPRNVSFSDPLITGGDVGTTVERPWVLVPFCEKSND